MKSIIEFKKQAKILSKERDLKTKEALDIISKENGCHRSVVGKSSIPRSVQ
ncbi:MAG: hypothetical protein ACJAS4_000786 [Bacteriovoracaceae bacterium]|jgi:hypothetical protein